MLKTLLLKSIRYYQNKGGSQALLGIDCNFEPSCSAYTYEAISHYGIIKGIKLGISRIKSCSQPDSICKCIEPLPMDSDRVKTDRS